MNRRPSWNWVFQTAKYGRKLLTVVPVHFSGLLRALVYQLETRIVLETFVRNSLEERMPREVIGHPDVQLLHVGDGVDQPSRSEDVGILGQKRLADDAALVVAFLEVGIGEQEEYLSQLMLSKVVGDVFHGISSFHADVGVLPGVFLAKLNDAVFHVLRNPITQLHAQDQV